MGTLIEDLDDHEGYVLWRLPDGTLTAAWTNDNRRQVTAYVAECECGWRSHRQHPPTDQGDEAARQEWVREHAVPELARQAERRGEQLASTLGWLAQKPTGSRTRTACGGCRRGWPGPASSPSASSATWGRSASRREADRER
jgi:hypothetical protein